jgi:hypothetical protein
MPSSPASNSAVTLGYEKRPQALVRLYVSRLFLISMLLILAAALAYMIVPGQWQAYQLRQHAKVLQSRRNACLAVTIPPNTVLFDDDPMRLASLMSTGAYVSSHPSLGRKPPFALQEIPVFELYGDTLSGHHSSNVRVAPILFVHQMMNPSGVTRLVALHLCRIDDDPLNRIFLQAYVDGYKTIPKRWTSPRALHTIRLPGESIAIFGGQLDPIDMSHFTVDYLLNNRRETIDGWLNDDETVSLVPRCGRVYTAAENLVIWAPGDAVVPLEITDRTPPTDLGHLNAAPTSRPATTP